MDENQFLRSYPEVARQGKNRSFADTALSTQHDATGSSLPVDKKGTLDRNIPFDRWDTNNNDFLSLDEYKSGLAGQSDLDERFNRFDKNTDGKLSREEFVGRKR